MHIIQHFILVFTVCPKYLFMSIQYTKMLIICLKKTINVFIRACAKNTVTVNKVFCFTKPVFTLLNGKAVKNLFVIPLISSVVECLA